MVAFSHKQFSSLKEYVRLLRDLFAGNGDNNSNFIFYDYLFKKGEQFNEVYAWKDKEVRDIFKWQQLRNPQKKHCYYNSQMLAIDFKKKGVKYYEGWAYTKKIKLPIEHAWCVRDGKIIDVTWNDGDKYFGLEIPMEMVIDKMIKTGYSSPLMREYMFDRVSIVAGLGKGEDDTDQIMRARVQLNLSPPKVKKRKI